MQLPRVGVHRCEGGIRASAGTEQGLTAQMAPKHGSTKLQVL